MIADFYQGVHTFGVHTFEGGGVAEQTCYENQKCEFVRPYFYFSNNKYDVTVL